MDPTDEETLDALERIYEDQSQPAKLADLLETRLALTVADEPVVRLNLRLAQLCEKVLEDPKRAERALEGVRRVEPHHEESLKSLSRIYEATSMWEQCVEVLRDLVIMEADPNERSLLYFKCGSIMESRFNRDEEAISYYQAALNETPACLPAIHACGISTCAGRTGTARWIRWRSRFDCGTRSGSRPGCWPAWAKSD